MLVRKKKGIFEEIFDMNLFLLGSAIALQNIYVCFLSTLFKVVRGCVHFRRKWVSEDNTKIAVDDTK